MSKNLEEAIARAKQFLGEVRHAAMATVNADGTPHNTPFMLMHDATLEHIYWSSHPQSQHSQNILRTGEIFVIIYDAVRSGGIYMKAVRAHPVEGVELDTALAVHNKLRVARGQHALPRTHYMGDSPQRMWVASVVNCWVHSTIRDEAGRIIKDERVEIEPADLLK